MEGSSEKEQSSPSFPQNISPLQSKDKSSSSLIPATTPCTLDAEKILVVLKGSLVSPTLPEYDGLQRWLQGKLTSGGGETMLDVGTGPDDSVSGLSVDDYTASVATLKLLSETQNADCVLLRERCGAGGTKEDKYLMGQYLVRKRAELLDFMEVRVAVVGNVDAGKSTLLGVLTHGELDNGRGTARMKLFRHKHEMESGRTSSVGNDILGFDSTGKVVNKPDHGHLDWVKICKDSSKVITFIDLAGHERYLKTTVFGMTGHLPDFTMLMVGANAGIVGMTKEHLGLALALNVPVMVVVTKIDMCPPNVMQDTLKLLHKILKSAGCRKVPLLIRNEDDVVVAATNFVSERLCPIFQVSNVEGTNLHLLTMFLNLLSTPRTSQDDGEPPHFQIDDTYQVPGVGVVVSGTCIKGIIRVNDNMLLGPNGIGDFVPMPIKSIHRKRMPVREVRGGQTASFALKKIKISEVRKGQVLVDISLNPTSCWEFKGEILVLHHPTTISTKYQAMVHVGPVRQTASIIAMDRDCLRTGDKATVHFRFIKHPEYLQPGLKMVFREGRTKAVGKVLEVIPKAASVHQQHRNHKIIKTLKQGGGGGGSSSGSGAPQTSTTIDASKGTGTVVTTSTTVATTATVATAAAIVEGDATQKGGQQHSSYVIKKHRSRRGGKHRSRSNNTLQGAPNGSPVPSTAAVQAGAAAVMVPASAAVVTTSGAVTSSGTTRSGAVSTAAVSPDPIKSPNPASLKSPRKSPMKSLANSLAKHATISVAGN